VPLQQQEQQQLLTLRKHLSEGLCASSSCPSGPSQRYGRGSIIEAEQQQQVQQVVLLEPSSSSSSRQSFTTAGM